MAFSHAESKDLAVRLGRILSGGQGDNPFLSACSQTAKAWQDISHQQHSFISTCMA